MKGCVSEDEVLRFVEGGLNATRIAAIEAHTRVCVTCEQWIGAAVGACSANGTTLHARDSARVTHSVPDRLDGGSLVGRYTVLSLAARGGMAEVYAAYDPQLDRRIALKVLHPGFGDANPRAEARLLREARAIARVSHPNVIAAYDAGTVGNRVFIAMEFVDGETLASWLTSQPRSRQEILKVFLSAARGLAAAHASGLIHRDFKPHNVMVTRDGTPRVTDFGLAQRNRRERHPDDEEAMGPVGPPSDPTITRPGEIIGTPLYMSPEQFRGDHTDARTDQFSFCVALYQALYGEHPFAGPAPMKMTALRAAVLGGQLRPAPASSTVPPGIRRVLARGLATRPEDRWPSMTELASALERDPQRSRARALLRAGAVLAALAVVAVAWRMAPGPAPLCAGGPSRLADVWPSQVTGSRAPGGAGLLQKFLATNVPGARELAARATASLDRYAASWLSMYREACEATNVRGEQSAEVLDLRMQCLDERRVSFKALVESLARADAVTVRNSVSATAELPDLQQCADTAGLRAAAEPSRGSELRAHIDDLRRRAALAKVAQNTGRHREALEQGRQQLAEARALGYAPLVAELLAMLAEFEQNSEFESESVGFWEEAAWIALSSKRDDIAARSATMLASIDGYLANRPDEARRWDQLAGALLDRLGPGHDRDRVWLLEARALRREPTDPDGALVYAEQALELARKVLPADHPDLGYALATVAEESHRRGDDERAAVVGQEAFDLMTRVFGPHSAQSAHTASNVGEYLVALGRPAEALPIFRDALADWEAAMGPHHRFLAYPLTGLGRALLALGRTAEARAPLERAFALREESEPRPVERAETSFALARALWPTADRKRAVKVAMAAQSEYAQARNPRVAEVSSWLAGHRL